MFIISPILNFFANGKVLFFLGYCLTFMHLLTPGSSGTIGSIKNAMPALFFGGIIGPIIGGWTVVFVAYLMMSGFEFIIGMVVAFALYHEIKQQRIIEHINYRFRVNCPTVATYLDLLCSNLNIGFWHYYPIVKTVTYNGIMDLYNRFYQVVNQTPQPAKSTN